ncbi:Lrp/AsnC family transcriptional regulator, partial [Streptomyces sp. NPDC005921]
MNSGTAPFDDLDRKITTALMANARTSFAEIGAAIGLSATAVKRRVDRLRETGVITGFTATVTPAALGWRTEAYVEVYCEGAAPPRRLAEVVRNHPEITAAMTVTGGADALLHPRPGRRQRHPGPRRHDPRLVATGAGPRRTGRQGVIT